MTIFHAAGVFLAVTVPILAWFALGELVYNWLHKGKRL